MKAFRNRTWLSALLILVMLLSVGFLAREYIGEGVANFSQ
jgi:hypothetical protein